MGKGNPHRRPAPPRRIPNTRNRTRSSKPKFTDPEQNSRDLALQLRALGLYAASTVGDGNCLFRALCDQLYGSPRDHLTLRREICDWMDTHKEHYQGFVEDGMTWEQHIDAMRQAGTYGGHLELCAVAHLKRRNVKVIQPGLVYVIEWSTGPRASSSSVELSSEAGPSSAVSSTEPNDSDKHLSGREERRARRERMKEAKDAQLMKSKAAEAEIVPVTDPNDTQSVPPDQLPAIYVAYHDWEHFSSVRNLTGPHQGIPNVIESSPPPGVDAPANSSSRRSKRSASTSQPSSLSTNNSRQPRSSSPATTTTTSGHSADTSSAPSSTSPQTPPDNVTSLNVATAIIKSRSPKRSFEESEEGFASGSEYGRADPKRSKGKTISVDEDAYDEEMVEEVISRPPGLSPEASTDGEDGDPDDGASTQNSTATSRSASISSRTRPKVPSPTLTKRQRKKAGVVSPPKPRRVVLLLGKKADKTAAATSKDAEWVNNGTGKMDVRGFRELKI